MLTVALEFKDVFPRFKQREESYNFLPSDEDWRKARVVCSFLSDYNKVTNVISGSEYPTSNLFLPHLWKIKKVLDNASAASNNNNDFLKEMVRRMKVKFDKYWGDSNILISVAVLLDPTRKMQFLNFCFKDIYGLEEAKEKLSLVLGDADFFKFVQREVSVTAKSELDKYLEDGIIVYDHVNNPPYDPLPFWKENRYKYRVLSQMACDILSISITSVASEAAFSAGSRVIDLYRASLSVDTVQVLICGADWLRSHYGIKKKEKVKATIEDMEYELP